MGSKQTEDAVFLQYYVLKYAKIDQKTLFLTPRGQKKIWGQKILTDFDR